MRPETKRELLLYWLPAMPDRGLDQLIPLLKERSSLLLRGAFRDDYGGSCVVHRLGESILEQRSLFLHSGAPEDSNGAVDFQHPGKYFVEKEVGLEHWWDSWVLYEWDTRPGFAVEFLAVLKREQFYRALLPIRRRKRKCAAGV